MPDSAVPTSRAFAAQTPDGSPSATARLAVQQIQQGRELFKRGQVLRARDAFLLAISSAPAEVLFELGRTFDPSQLASLRVSDGQADPQSALMFYEEAFKHGSAFAPAAIDRLRRDNPGLQ